MSWPRTHMPDDELGDMLVPMNNRWPVADALDAARYYYYYYYYYWS